MPENLESSKSFDFGKLIGLAYLVVLLCAFSWAKEFLLPMVLAILISFLLAPAVSRLERWGLHPVLAVLSVVAIAFVIIGVLCTTLSVQSLNLVNSLPKYRDNIDAKWTAIQKGPPGPLNLAFRNIGAVISDLGKVTASAGGTQQPEPTKVQIVSGAEGVAAIVKNSLTPVMGPIAEFAVVVVLVVFMLLERKRLRVRFLRLIGHSHVATTTLAVDEAGSRLSSFLLGQLLVNGGYALVLGLGLSLIGIPNALLWAALTLVLRFLPYVGLWISAFFPLILSIAISTSWKEPDSKMGQVAKPQCHALRCLKKLKRDTKVSVFFSSEMQRLPDIREVLRIHLPSWNNAAASEYFCAWNPFGKGSKPHSSLYIVHAFTASGPANPPLSPL
jgi:predicted PurR-regulated permease PerM